MQLQTQTAVYLRQRLELAELILGFETRNKYEILGDNGQQLGFVAEQQKGILGFLFRQWLGHWRRFDLHVFDLARRPTLIVRHPFRIFFQRLEVTTPDGQRVGFIQQRFGLLYKRFDIEDPRRLVVFTMSSPIWKIWTFPLRRNGKELAVIHKRWSGLLREVLTDGDRFSIVFKDPTLTENERQLMLVAGIFVDLEYFERKGNK